MQNRHAEKEGRRHNSTFAIGGVSCSTDSLVVAESFVLRIKFSSKNPPIAKRQNVMPHPKKTETTMTEKMKHQKANASAKSKELHPMLKANTMQHICFCPNRTLKISNKL